MNFVFLLLIGCCHGLNVSEIEWAIVKTLPIGSKVNLECQYTKAVNCRWRRADDEVDIDYRYRYLTGDGQNTTDCSIQIIYVTKRDFNWWTCEIYDPSGANQPVAKLWHVLIKNFYSAATHLVMFQPLKLEGTTYEDEFLSCSATTYVDKCFYMDLIDDPSTLLEHYKNKNVYTKTCTWEARYITNYKQKYCGLGKEIHLPRKLNDDVIELECDDMTDPVACSWRFNQQELQIGGHIKYRHQSVNSKDCSIHVNISNSPKEVQGLWECRMQTNYSSSSILNVYSILTSPTIEEEESTTAYTDVSTFDNNSTSTAIQNIIFQSDGRVFICLLVMTMLIIIKFILSAIFWLNKQFRPEGRQIKIRHVESEEMINKSSGSL